MLKNKYKYKIIALLMVIFAMNYVVLSNKKIVAGTLDKDVITVGMELKFPPFETVDKDGKPMGVSVDLANALGEKLGKRVEIKSIDYAGLVPALQSNNIDMIISSMTVTEERLQSIDFSDEYAKSDLSLLINSNSDVESYEDLNNEKYTIAVKQGNLGAMWAKKNAPKAKVKEFSEVSAGMLDVNNGSSDVFIYDPLTLIEGSLNLSNVKINITPLPDVNGWGVGMRKNEDVLKISINKALQELKEENFFDDMRNKYLNEEVEKYESYGLKYFF